MSDANKINVWSEDLGEAGKSRRDFLEFVAKVWAAWAAWSVLAACWRGWSDENPDTPDTGGTGDGGVDTWVETQTVTSMELSFDENGGFASAAPEYRNSTVTIEFSAPVEVGSDGIMNFPQFTEISVPVNHPLGWELFLFITREDTSQSWQAGFNFSSGWAPWRTYFGPNNSIADTTFDNQEWGWNADWVMKFQALGGTRWSIQQLRYFLDGNNSAFVQVFPKGWVPYPG